MFRHISASHLRSVYYLNLAFSPRRKNDISGYISPRSFVQMVKCSLFDQKLFIKVSLVRHSCLGIFYFKVKFCVSHTSASCLRDVYF